MTQDMLTFADATAAHFAAIIEIERTSGPGSIVALTNGGALEEAIGRGHEVIVALDGGDVAGWVWFSADAGRGGETVGQMYRVAVAAERRRRGVGRALVERAQHILAQRRCIRVRATVPGDDDGARAFLSALGYAVDAIMLERPL